MSGLELDFGGLWERPYIFRKTMFHSTCHKDQENSCLPICCPRKLWRWDCSLSKEKMCQNLFEKKLNGKYISPCSVWIHRGTLAGRKTYKKEMRNHRKGKILKHRLNLTQKVVIWEQRDILYPYSVNHCCSVEIHPSLPEEKLAYGSLLVCQSFIKCTSMPSL